MKTLLSTVALAALIATPALAQTTRTQNQLRAPNINAKSASPFYSGSVRRSHNATNDVFDTSGRYIGSDPDPSIRAELAQDPSGGD